MGAAVGTIMAIIMTAHITNMDTQSTGLQELMLGMAMAMLVPMLPWLWAT